ncbi:MAG: P-type conjugative transfer protein TrbJ, partial [Sphingorhabdus sp.]
MSSNKILTCLLGLQMPLLVLGAFGCVHAPASAMPVFDQANYAQNLLQAARALQQINQQVRQLQNEARIITQGERHLERLEYSVVDQLTTRLQRIEQLMEEAQAIGFRTNNVEAAFQKMFPGHAGEATKSGRVLGEARARFDAAMTGFRKAMALQAQVVENVEVDARLLSDLVAQSQGASGSLQAQQAANQLLALAAKQ